MGTHLLVAANSCGFLDPGNRISTIWQAVESVTVWYRHDV